MLHKPKTSTTSKKRKASTPPPTPPTNIARNLDKPKIQTSSAVTPNPYREEFILYKEKLIENLYNFIYNNFITKTTEGSQIKPTNLDIREQISHIFEPDTIDSISISDDGSLY